MELSKTDSQPTDAYRNLLGQISDTYTQGQVRAVVIEMGVSEMQDAHRQPVRHFERDSRI